VIIPTDARDATGALRQADTRMYQDKGQSRPSAPAQTCRALLATLYERNPGLEAHGLEVAALASKVAARLNMSAEERDEVQRAAELHDLGKVAIPDAILEKPGPLDEEEWEFMRRHTLVGERILSAAPALVPVARLVRSSHERVDGGGYPDGLAGDDIPLGARVVAVCDAYEAMTEPRPYREPVARDAALAELRRCAGTQFDADVVRAFEFVVRAQPALTESSSPA
jgi:HD-GYP domain-containing protein (c-di-GMP phosphodiesterase class II)